MLCVKPTLQISFKNPAMNYVRLKRTPAFSVHRHRFVDTDGKFERVKTLQLN
jgi:hypothetical protein